MVFWGQKKGAMQEDLKKSGGLGNTPSVQVKNIAIEESHLES